MITHKKSAPQISNLYELQSTNLDTIYRYLRWFKEKRCFQKKENDNNIKEVECYNCDIKEHYVRDCYKLRKSQNLVAIKWGPEDTKQQVLAIMTE